MLTQEQKDNTQKLIDALRSGQYKQGQNALCGKIRDGSTMVYDPNPTYCCLGVAGKILGLTDEQLKIEENSHSGNDRGLFLSPAMAEKFGFDQEEQRQLSEWNDADVDFDRIADRLAYWLKNDGVFKGEEVYAE